ncbi:hypothetical protein NL452_26560, partial [Klebsiella pneumoniae]|nr:hypothetical protein [Klebsiella pneumoniae]
MSDAEPVCEYEPVDPPLIHSPAAGKPCPLLKGWFAVVVDVPFERTVTVVVQYVFVYFEGYV